MRRLEKSIILRMLQQIQQMSTSLIPQQRLASKHPSGHQRMVEEPATIDFRLARAPATNENNGYYQDD